MFNVLSRFVMSAEAMNLLKTAAVELSNLNVRCVADLYKNTDAYRRGYEMGYQSEIARRKTEV